MFKDVERLSYPCVDRGICTAVRIKPFRISNRFLNFRSKRGRMRFTEKFSEKMNVRPELKQAALLQRMEFWLLRAKHGPIGNCSKSRGTKNFWALVRRHRALAERAGFRETDVF